MCRAGYPVDSHSSKWICRNWTKSCLSAGINSQGFLSQQTASAAAMLEGRWRLLCQAFSEPLLKTEVLFFFVWELSPHYPPDRMGADSIRDAGLHTGPRGMSLLSSSSMAALWSRGRHTSTSSQTPSLAGFLFFQLKAAAEGHGASTPPSTRLPTDTQVSLADAFSQG